MFGLCHMRCTAAGFSMVALCSAIEPFIIADEHVPCILRYGESVAIVEIAPFEPSSFMIVAEVKARSDTLQCQDECLRRVYSIGCARIDAVGPAYGVSAAPILFVFLGSLKRHGDRYDSAILRNVLKLSRCNQHRIS